MLCVVNFRTPSFCFDNKLTKSMTLLYISFNMEIWKYGWLGVKWLGQTDLYRPTYYDIGMSLLYAWLGFI